MKRFYYVKHWILIAFIFSLFWSPLGAQGTLEDYQRAEKFLQKNMEKMIYHARVVPHWIGKTSRFWYKNDTREGKEFILIDAEKKSREPAFDHRKMAKALSKLTKKKYRPFALPFDRFTIVDQGKAIAFGVGSQHIQCNLETYKCKKIEKEKKDPSVSISPDGQWTAFIKNYNLYIRSTKTGEEFQLTTDGADNYAYAINWNLTHYINENDPSKTEPIKSIYVSWSPDSSKLLTHRVDYRNAKKSFLYQSLPQSGYRAQIWSYYHALPGETGGRMFDGFIFDMKSKTGVALDPGPLSSLLTRGYPLWFKDSRRLHFFHYTRGYKKIILLEIDGETGKSRRVFEESSKTYIDPNKRIIKVLGNGEEFLWASERDGWNHLYLYDWKTGGLKNRVTEGEFVIRNVIVDERRRQVYFTANGREPGSDPYFRYLYRVNLDGTGLVLLSPGNGDHRFYEAPNGRYFVDVCSRIDMPPVTVLRSALDGKVVLPLEKADISDLLAAGWKFPEPFKVKARDGKTDIYGAIFRPANFDPGKKYPVIDHSYSGAQRIYTPKFFLSMHLHRNQVLAQLGFIVVVVDGLGTSYRSKTFQDFSYKNVGDIGALDHIGAIKQLARKYPYMDLSRVGIYGISAGGYDAAHALLTHPEFYKVGVSMAGSHDHRMVRAPWPEQYQGYPVGDHYAEQSNVTLAKNLQGKLLLMHGDLDSNVNPVCTLRLAGELVKENKDFDLVIIPNRGHNLFANPYAVRKLWDYFVRHLLGVTPPPYRITTKL